MRDPHRIPVLSLHQGGCQPQVRKRQLTAVSASFAVEAVVGWAQHFGDLFILTREKYQGSSAGAFRLHAACFQHANELRVEIINSFSKGTLDAPSAIRLVRDLYLAIGVLISNLPLGDWFARQRIKMVAAQRKLVELSVTYFETDLQSSGAVLTRAARSRRNKPILTVV